jgi:hypothetical protein
MNFALKKILTIGLVLVVAYGFTFGVPPEWVGEVVELETYGPRGGTQLTTLWIVDGNGQQWLRASGGESSWVSRIRKNPAVHLTRDGQRKPFHAEVAAGLLPRVNLWMHEKYGRADTLVSVVQDSDEVVVIRLVDKSNAGRWGDAYP